MFYSGFLVQEDKVVKHVIGITFSEQMQTTVYLLVKEVITWKTKSSLKFQFYWMYSMMQNFWMESNEQTTEQSLSVMTAGHYLLHLTYPSWFHSEFQIQLSWNNIEIKETFLKIVLLVIIETIPCYETNIASLNIKYLQVISICKASISTQTSSWYCQCFLIVCNCLSVPPATEQVYIIEIGKTYRRIMSVERINKHHSNQTSKAVEKFHKWSGLFTEEWNYKLITHNLNFHNLQRIFFIITNILRQNVCDRGRPKEPWCETLRYNTSYSSF